MTTFKTTISLLVFSLSLIGCAGSSGSVAPSAPSEQPPIIHTLSALPYGYSALEPVIDTETMKIHHTKHHQAYVDNLNKALQGSPGASLELEKILASVSTFPVAVRNNGGGHWNHTFFWKVMTAPKNSGKPSEKLSSAITATFGSLDSFKEKFGAAGTGRFGSGWAWLVATPQGLVITSTPNQDNPLMDIAEVKGTPLLALDVWEHAYYLKYRNKRADYIKNWWSVVNWAEVSRVYEETLRSR
jgi:Fe-Mn family superoxide dismutase